MPGGFAARRGAAMPWVLGGMGLALAVGVLSWNRAWTHRQRAAVQSAQWQAQLLAESALACAQDEVWTRFQGGSSTTANSTWTALGSNPALSPVDSCPVPFGSKGSLAYEIEEGNLLVPVLASGEVPFGDRTIGRSLRAVLAGALDNEMFDVAISQWVASTPPLDISGSRIVGKIRVAGAAPTGMLGQPIGPLGLTSFVPTSGTLDTTVLSSRMKESFREEEAFQGGGTYSRGVGFPEREKIVHASSGSGNAEVILDGPISATSPWRAPSGKTLVVEGDVVVRGHVELDGWTILARGRISLERGSRVLHGLLFAERGVVLSEDAVFQGQILAFASLKLQHTARILGPTVAVCWAGEQGGEVLLEGTSQANAYLVALGGASTIRIEREALLEGVAVSGGTLRVDGKVHGVSVAGRFDCGRATTSCTGSGTFDRTLLPADFVVPLGLPGARSMRVAKWELAK